MAHIGGASFGDRKPVNRTHLAIAAAAAYCALVAVLTHYDRLPWLFLSLPAAAYLFGFRRWSLLIQVTLFAAASCPYGAFLGPVRWPVLFLSALLSIGFTSWNELEFGQHMFDRAVLALVCATFLSAMYSANSTMTLLKSCAFLAVITYAGFGAPAAVKALKGRFVTSYAVTSVCALIVVAVCYWVLNFEVMGNPNNLGALLSVFVWPAVLWLSLCARLHLRVVGIVASVATLALTYYSLSRASMLAEIVAAFVVLVCARRFRALAMLAVACVCLSAVLVGPARDFVQKGDDPDMLKSRRDLIEDSLDRIQRRPLQGEGFGVTAGLSEYWDGGTSSNEFQREEGNSFLGIVCQLGLLGAVPIVIALLCIAGQMYRMARGRVAQSDVALLAVGVVSAGLVNATFEAWLFAGGFYLCLLFWSFSSILTRSTAMLSSAPQMPPAEIRQQLRFAQ